MKKIKNRLGSLWDFHLCLKKIGKSVLGLLCLLVLQGGLLFSETLEEVKKSLEGDFSQENRGKALRFLQKKNELLPLNSSEKKLFLQLALWNNNPSALMWLKKQEKKLAPQQPVHRIGKIPEPENSNPPFPQNLSSEDFFYLPFPDPIVSCPLSYLESEKSQVIKSHEAQISISSEFKMVGQPGFFGPEKGDLPYLMGELILKNLQSELEFHESIRSINHP